MSEKKIDEKLNWALTCDGCGLTKKSDQRPDPGNVFGGAHGWRRRYYSDGETVFDLCADCEIKALKGGLKK